MRLSRFFVAASVSIASWFGSPPQADTPFIRATFDLAPDHSGVGELATGGPWDSGAAVEIGTGTVSVPAAGASLFVDPLAGLGGSTRGLHFSDRSAAPGCVASFEPGAGAVPAAGSVYWVDYRFRMDPEGTDAGEPMIEVALYADGAGPQIVRSWLGWFPFNGDGEPYFRYAIFEGATAHKGQIAPLDPADEWRVLIKIDGVHQQQTHWLWKNGETQVHAILGRTFALTSPIAGADALARLRFLSNNPADVEAIVDQIDVSDSGPPAPPSALIAVPNGTDRIAVSWTDGSADETGFVLERSLTEAGDWIEIAAPGPDETFLLDAGLGARAPYYYRVAARNERGLSPWSNTTWARTAYTGKPLEGWVSVTDFGADGQDELDDTEALQRAINEVIGSQPVRPRVLYIPDGTYRISQTLFIEQQIGAQIVGESTAGVILEWHGPPGTYDDGVCSGNPAVSCTSDADCDPTRNDLCGLVTPQVLLHADGATHSTWRNLTWDAGGIDYVVLFDQSYCGRSDTNNYNDQCTGLGNPWFQLRPDKGFADIGSGHIDSAFRNAWIGLRIGHYNVQDSEITVRRSRFENNTAGISIEDYNALNVWIWDSRFEGNARGVTNAMNNFGAAPNNGAGDFRVMRGRFEANGRDISMAPTGGFTFRECWSKGSGQFLHAHGSTGTACRMSIIDTQIDDFDPTGEFAGRAIEVRNAGVLLLLDNAIDTTTAGATREEPVFASTFNWSEVLGIANATTATDAYQGANLRLRSVGDRLAAEPFDLAVPASPQAIDALESRPIYTVTDEANLQAVLDAAEADPAPAVVHVPAGSYAVGQTLTIGAASDLIVMGDGPATELRWVGEDDGPMVRIDGHQANGVTLRDLQLRAKSPAGVQATAVEVRDLNQEASRALVSRVEVIDPRVPAPGVGLGVAVEGCDRTRVDLVDLSIDGRLDNVGVQVSAGPQPQAGTAIWTGNMNSNAWDFDVVNNIGGVRLLVSSTYMEKSSHYLRARSECGEGTCGFGDVCIHSAKAAAEATTDTGAFLIDDFRGNVGMVNNEFWDIDPANEGARIEQVGPAEVEIQLLGNIAYWEPEHQVESAHVIRTSGNYGCIVPYTKDPLLDPTHPLCDLPCAAPCGARCEPPAYPSCADFPYIPAPDRFDPAADPARLDAGVNLLRSLTMPRHYDEPGASETYQVNLDYLRIFDPAVGVRLSGGIPGNPTGLEATPVGSARVELEWTDGIDDEDGFRIERAPASGTVFEALATVGPGVVAFADEAVVDGTAYDYRVSAYRDRTGASAPSRASATTGLAAPFGLRVDVGVVGELVLSWQDGSASEAGFRIERSLEPDVGFAEIATTAADTVTFTDGDLVAATTYHYRVQAFNAAAGVSPYSNTAWAVVDSPGQIADLRVDPSAAGADAVDLSWQPSCSGQAVDYGIYEGQLGQWYSHGIRQCSTRGATTAEAYPADPGSRYFLVVPLGASYEGSYGTDSAGTQRPQPDATCREYRVPDACP